jgi:dihydroxyacid dehydratase/phosphogluconate dehydratase
VFGTPTISDGMAMGTEGMKYSLVSREVIADCIETCVNGQWMDGVVVIGGCDKNMPGGMMGMLRANVPASTSTAAPSSRALEGPGPEHRQRVRGRRPEFAAGA